MNERRLRMRDGYRRPEGGRHRGMTDKKTAGIIMGAEYAGSREKESDFRESP